MKIAIVSKENGLAVMSTLAQDLFIFRNVIQHPLIRGGDIDWPRKYQHARSRPCFHVGEYQSRVSIVGSIVELSYFNTL